MTCYDVVPRSLSPPPSLSAVITWQDGGHDEGAGQEELLLARRNKVQLDFGKNED